MPRTKKIDNETADETSQDVVSAENQKKPKINDVEWTDYVLDFLGEDEKIMGNPTTDGLRRIFETVLNCRLLLSTSNVVQSPSHENDKRATVVHSLTYRLNPESPDPENINTLTVDGSADVYWGNCDKVYRNHPVAVAETRAEGRALRRALRLRKVVAAEELAKEIEDHPDGNNIDKITNNQINFIDVLASRLDINVLNLINKLAPNTSNVYNIKYDTAIEIVKTLTNYQQTNSFPEELLGYNSDWK
jgi:hypothetical protein